MILNMCRGYFIWRSNASSPTNHTIRRRGSSKYIFFFKRSEVSLGRRMTVEQYQQVFARKQRSINSFSCHHVFQENNLMREFKNFEIINMPKEYTNEELIELQNAKDTEEMRAIFKRIREKRLRKLRLGMKYNNRNYKDRI